MISGLKEGSLESVFEGFKHFLLPAVSHIKCFTPGYPFALTLSLTLADRAAAQDPGPPLSVPACKRTTNEENSAEGYVRVDTEEAKRITRLPVTRTSVCFGQAN